MKKTSFLLGVLAVLLTQGILYAQDPNAVCAANQRSAIRLMSNGTLTLSAAQQKQVYDWVKPCADRGDATAICNLAILYKDGIHVAQDFGRSFELFTQSANAGHEKAKYALGYFYMKGLGGVAQDYEKAIEHYQSSTDLMAIHWLEYCRYFGYGIQEDKAGAARVLNYNLVGNSGVLAQQLFDELDPTTGVPPTQFSRPPAEVATNSDYQKAKQLLRDTPSDGLNLTNKQLEMHLVEYDWSGTRILSYHPMHMEVVDGRRFEEATLSVNGRTIRDAVTAGEGKIDFLHLEFTLPRLYSDDTQSKQLTYRLKSIRYVPTFRKNGLASTEYVGIPEMDVTDFKEPARNFVVYFGARNAGSPPPTPGQLLTNLKITPNPIVGSTADLSFEANDGAAFTVTATSTAGGSPIVLLDSFVNNKALHKVRMDVSGLQLNRMYIITVTTHDGHSQYLRVVRQ